MAIAKPSFHIVERARLFDCGTIHVEFLITLDDDDLAIAEHLVYLAVVQTSIDASDTRLINLVLVNTCNLGGERSLVNS